MNPQPHADATPYMARAKLIIAAFTRRRGCDRCGHGLAEHLIGPDEVGQPHAWCLHDISGALTAAGRLHTALRHEVQP
jgi:hypothetical protein